MLQDVVTVKGWRNGLLIVLPVAGSWDDLRAALDAKLGEARTRAFWRGAQTTLDFGARETEMSPDAVARLTALLDHLRETYELAPVAVVTQDAGMRELAQQIDLNIYEALPVANPLSSAPSAAVHATDGGAPMSDSTKTRLPPPQPPRVPATLPPSPTESANDTIANALYVPGTVRSGQRIVHRGGSVVVGGDVNAGAEIIAGGDVVVFGTLRGLAHAGASVGGAGNEAARILAGLLKAQQIRIANKIARAPEEDEAVAKKGDRSAPSAGGNNATAPGFAEVARIENGEIQIFPH